MCSRTTCATSAPRRSRVSSSIRSPPSFPTTRGSRARGTRASPVACGCAFQWGSEVEMTWASSLNAYKRIAPNMLLYYRFMERAIDVGIDDVQLRPHITGQRHASLQDAVGHARRAALVVRSRREHRGEDAVAHRFRLRVGPAHLEATSHRRRHDARPADRALHPLIGRHQLPVSSTITARSLARAVAPALTRWRARGCGARGRAASRIRRAQCRARGQRHVGARDGDARDHARGRCRCTSRVRVCRHWRGRHPCTASRAPL